MRQPYRLLTFVLALCAVVAVAGAFVLLHMSHTADFDLEVGKWLLTVALAFALTGALAIVVKQIDQRRSERQAWQDILNDLVGANQKVILARVRLQAHQSAKTYQEQLAEVMAVRVEVRRIGALDIVNRDDTLSGQITAMREYLDALGREYAAGYLRVARQQRLDEAWLTKQVNEAKDGESAPLLPDQLAGPTLAWCLLKDASQFPGSRRFWMKGHFRSTPSALITSWRRSVLRGVPASVTRPSSPRYFGDGSSPRARGTSRPPMRNVWVTLRRRSQTAIACSTKPVTKVIQVAIWTEIVGLSKLTAEAVNVVYPEPKGDVVAGNSAQ